MKAAVIVLSDPNGGEEALGRVFNALPVPGTPGLTSLAKYVADGYTVLTF